MTYSFLIQKNKLGTNQKWIKINFLSQEWDTQAKFGMEVK